MISSARNGGGRCRLPQAQRWRRGTLEGDEVVYLQLGNATSEVIVSAATWELYRALGYPVAVFLRTDGHDRNYLSHSFTTPGITETDPRDFVRTLYAIILVRDETLNDPKADLRGKEVKLRKPKIDGNFDLRDGSMSAMDGSPRNGGWQAVADVRKRWAIRFPTDGSPGQDPHAIFAEIRREERAAKKGSSRQGGEIAGA